MGTKYILIIVLNKCLYNTLYTVWTVILFRLSLAARVLIRSFILDRRIPTTDACISISQTFRLNLMRNVSVTGRGTNDKRHEQTKRVIAAAQGKLLRDVCDSFILWFYHFVLQLALLSYCVTANTLILCSGIKSCPSTAWIESCQCLNLPIVRTCLLELLHYLLGRCSWRGFAIHGFYWGFAGGLFPRNFLQQAH